MHFFFIRTFSVTIRVDSNIHSYLSLYDFRNHKVPLPIFINKILNCFITHSIIVRRLILLFRAEIYVILMYYCREISLLVQCAH